MVVGRAAQTLWPVGTAVVTGVEAGTAAVVLAGVLAAAGAPVAVAGTALTEAALMALAAVAVVAEVEAPAGAAPWGWESPPEPWPR